MKIDIICVGKLKEDYLKAAQKEYLKRLTPYGRFFVYEVQEGSLESEAAKIEKLLADGVFRIAMAIEGESISSMGFAQKLVHLGLNGKSHVAFLIGGSIGLSKDILHSCHLKLSFSAMTFPHQLARIMLLEQIYRAFRIIKNEPYHK